jgi:Tfp pilus assembly protein PilF
MRWRGTRCAVLLGATLAIGATGGSQTPTAPLVRENAYRANNLGVALLEQFKFEEAAAAFREALKAPTGSRHRTLQSWSGAAARWRRRRRDNGGGRRGPSPAHGAAAAYLLGVIARTENRDADASRFFGRVRDIDPRDGGTAVNLAQIAIQDRRYADAIELLQAAVADEPYNITAVYNLGMAMTRAGQRDEGQRLMERSQALRETGYGTTLSSSYLEQGKYAEALASTGAESELVDPATPRVAFTLSTVPAGGTAPSASATPSPTDEHMPRPT